MGKVQRDGWTIHYEQLGPDDGRPLVVVAGMGEQIGSVEFPAAQCQMFADAGHRVIRLDNRDSGLSVPDVEPPAPYVLTEMADDVVAVLDDAGVGSALLAGASMGAAIVRWVALRRPDRVGGLLVVMGASGAGTEEHGPQVPGEAWDRINGMAVRRPRPDAIACVVEMWRWLWGDSHPFDKRWVEERVAASYDRSYRPEGIGRYVAASAPTGLWEAQRAIVCPVVVMHGDEDPCCPPDHGRAIAERIPGAELWAIPTMGHVMHEDLWPAMTDRLLQLGTRAARRVS